ncbi:hypothetical protein N594_00040 [Streptococcus equi subsp. zooepidemicus Sz16]|nr:hypothetical protein N594_00040 [Streptococcus equi subsp. zooepidemicus Sz16]
MTIFTIINIIFSIIFFSTFISSFHREKPFLLDLLFFMFNFFLYFSLYLHILNYSDNRKCIIMNLKQQQAHIKQKQSRDMVIVSLMNDTGWSRSRVEKSLRDLERFNLIKFPDSGGMMLKIVEAK